MKDSGGPAFPTTQIDGGCDGIGKKDGVWHFPGMTLRDYFAAKAMQALLQDGFQSLAKVYQDDTEALLQTGFQSLAKVYQDDTDAVKSIIAKSAYEVADAMILESKKT